MGPLEEVVKRLSLSELNDLTLVIESEKTTRKLQLQTL